MVASLKIWETCTSQSSVYTACFSGTQLGLEEREVDTYTWFVFLAGVGDVWVSEGDVWEVWACCTSTLTDLSALPAV